LNDQSLPVRTPLACSPRNLTGKQPFDYYPWFN